MNEKILAECTSQILEELDKACTKYPGVCPAFLNRNETLEHIRTRLAIARHESDLEGKDLCWSVQNTLHEEVLEAYEAYAEKDYKHCLEELAQVGCVVIRAMAFIKEKHNG